MKSKDCFTKFGDNIYVNLNTKPGKDNIGCIINNDDAPETVQKISNVILTNYIKDYIFSILKDKNISYDNIDLLMPLFLNYFKGDLAEFNKFKKLPLPFLDYANQEIVCLDNVTKYYSRYLNPMFFKKLINIELYGKPIIGKAEAYLSLFSQFSNTLSTEYRGDIKDIKTNSFVEVKTSKGRLGGQTARHNGTDAMKGLDKAFDGLLLNNNNKTFSKGVCATIGNYIKENWASQFNKRSNLDRLCFNISNYEIPWSNEFKQSLEHALDNNTMHNFVACIHYWGYKIQEGFDYLFVVDTSHHKIVSLSSEKEFAECYDFFNKYIQTTIGWSLNSADAAGASINFDWKKVAKTL